MALSLQDPKTDALARQLAALTGETLTQAIRAALAERLKRERLKRGRPADLADELKMIFKQTDQASDLDLRTPDEIVGYDAHGLPR